MGYQLLSLTRPVARHEHQCIWCPEKIERGLKHVHEVSVFDGQFQNHRWHEECSKAHKESFDPNEPELYPHECKRGTNQHA